VNPALRYILEGVKPLWGLRKAGSALFRKPVTTGKARILPAETSKLSAKGRKLPKGHTRDIPARPSPGIDTTTIPGGFFRRRPGAGVTAGLGLLGVGGATAYGLLDDDGPSTDDTDDKIPPPPTPERVQEKSASPGQREAYQKKRRDRLKKGMKQLLNQYMIVAAVSPDEADNFLKAGMKMMETDQDFKDDLYIQDAYDTVFQPGNMPSSAREAFTMLSPLVGTEEAMKFSGDYHDIMPEYKEHQYMTKQRMEMRDVVALDNSGDRPGAIAMLIRGWQSGSFKTRPDHLVIGQSSKEDWIQAANEAIDLMTTGSATAGAGGTNWALPSSNEMS